MKVTLWGTRGSLATSGPDTIRFGGNTSCVSVVGDQGTVLVLDAGTGIRGLGKDLPDSLKKVNVLLTHLHMDHLQGLPFFAPLLRLGVEVNIFGPASTTSSLKARLLRYLSPPLFPISTRDLLATQHFHEIAFGSFEIDEFKIIAHLVLHPNPTVGYRISDGQKTVTYLPDHEPALGARKFPRSKDWTSGFCLAEGVDLLIHDAQYTDEEYQSRMGFGHSSVRQAFQFAEISAIKHLVPFHHDPAHSDQMLDEMINLTIEEFQPNFQVTPGTEGLVLQI